MLKAVGKNLVVKLVHDEKVGTIIIPDTAQAQNSGFHGLVISVGEEFQYDVKPGDKVIYFRSEGFVFDHENEEYLSVHQKHVLGIITEGGQ